MIQLPGGSSSRGSHRLSKVEVCPRAWYLSTVLGIEPKRRPEYFMMGTACHVALAYHFAPRLEVKPEWFLQVPLDDALNITCAGYPEAISLAKSVMPAYRQRYGDDAQWKIVSIEQEYTATVGELRALVGSASRDGDEERVSCRIDLLVEYNGRLVAVDYKTIGRGGRNNKLETYNYEGEYALPWQFLLQHGVLLHNFGDRFGGIMIERILKKAPHDFHRQAIAIPQEAFYALPDVVSRLCKREQLVIDDMKAAHLAGIDLTTWWPDGSFWSCFPYGKPCEYRSLCLASNKLARKEILAYEYQTK